MKQDADKPTPEAKALSLFLMAYKSKDPIYKEKAKHMNRLWNLVYFNKMKKVDYHNEVQTTLDSYGGYEEVIEKTVRFYVERYGKWSLEGDDKYCRDARVIADKVMEE